MRVDLNADLGEGFGPWKLGDDDTLLAHITSANVACGFHAGDPEIMATTFASARRQGVAIGAHPGFADRSGFGRRDLPCSDAEIENLVAYQIGAACALAQAVGHQISYVKLHGALYNRAADNPQTATATARAVRAVNPQLVLLARAGSQAIDVAQNLGLKTAAEAFADRAYRNDGSLAPRQNPESLITNVQDICTRVQMMLTEKAITSIGGQKIPVAIDSVCIHGDTPNAPAIAQALAQTLTEKGWKLAAFAAHTKTMPPKIMPQER